MANPSAITGSCGEGTIAAAGGGGSIAISGGTIAPATGCSFTVNVTATGSVLNLLTHPGIAVTSHQAAAGGSAAVSVFIGDPFQINYSPNVDIADSAINITNAGAGEAFSTAAGGAGPICVNVYAFSPDEQMVSCCSCLVAPNGLVSFSLRDDLISNTLNLGVPDLVVVKLLSTAPADGTCSNSAATISQAGLSAGMAAWGTKVHTFAKAPWATETTSSGSILSAGELARLSFLCSSIYAGDSDFGVCPSCRTGGLGTGGR